MVKIACFSDTHNKHKEVKLPECDIAIYAGDLTSYGYKHEVESFLNWYSKQDQCKEKVFICGNHDRSFDPKYEHIYESNKWLKEMIVSHDKLFYLENSTVILDGLKIWGSPITPWFNGDRWGFNKQRGRDIKEVWEKIPDDTDIVVTHGPVSYILDLTVNDYQYVGCADLDYRLRQIQPKLHVCGHIHEGYGLVDGVMGMPNTKFVNASICTLSYEPKNSPIVVEL